ncbi:MAG: hypothetical protein M1840_002384 [Geoglossum simile]|nr:MAG: hypothetical protein M1840_002384 [Geoglossum simile]
MAGYDQKNGTSPNFTQTALFAPLPILTSMSAFIAISWYNTIALNVVLWFTFKRRSGLYFYTLLIASWGIVLHGLGFLLMFFGVARFAVAMVVISVGWYAMVTGQSLVLYSRLHLVVRDSRRVRWVLYMIVANAILFHFPTTTFFVLVHNNPKLLPKYAIWERIQVTFFVVQEIIISSLYIYETRKLLNPSKIFQKERIRRVMTHLIYVSIFVIFLDISILCIQYANFFEIQVVYKGAVYSVKLFIEFFILNQLMGIFAHKNKTDNSYKLSNNRFENTTTAKSAPIAPPCSCITTTTTHEPALGYSISVAAVGNNNNNNDYNSPRFARLGDKMNQVVMSTEVTVQHEDSRPRINNRTRDGSLARGGKQASPASSGLNFATHGY